MRSAEKYIGQAFVADSMMLLSYLSMVNNNDEHMCRSCAIHALSYWTMHNQCNVHYNIRLLDHMNAAVSFVVHMCTPCTTQVCQLLILHASGCEYMYVHNSSAHFSSSY